VLPFFLFNLSVYKSNKILYKKENTLKGNYMNDEKIAFTFFSLKSIVGGKITKLISSNMEVFGGDEDEEVEGFQVEVNGKTFNCFILGDAEGNSAGHLDIQTPGEFKYVKNFKAK